MKINSIQSYNYGVKNCDCNKKKINPAFSARIPAQTERKILTEAVENGSEFLASVRAQLANIRKWGQSDTKLTEAFDFDNGKTVLGLDNSSISTMYGANLPNKTSLLDTVMSLKEKDIIKAEKDLKQIVDDNKTDLIVKALNDDKLMNKIVHKSNASDEELAEAIDKLSEERITELRFGLDEPSKYPSNDDIIHFDFSA